jgi:hypothetical protein
LWSLTGFLIVVYLASISGRRHRLARGVVGPAMWLLVA